MTVLSLVKGCSSFIGCFSGGFFIRDFSEKLCMSDIFTCISVTFCFLVTSNLSLAICLLVTGRLLETDYISDRFIYQWLCDNFLYQFRISYRLLFVTDWFNISRVILSTTDSSLVTGYLSVTGCLSVFGCFISPPFLYKSQFTHTRTHGNTPVSSKPMTSVDIYLQVHFAINWSYVSAAVCLSCMAAWCSG